MPDHHYDVVVAGGGPSGIAAAIAAAREGAKTLLIERYGFLGGAGTAMMVNPWMSYWAVGKEDHIIIFGVLKELIDGMTALGAYGHPKQMTAFDPEALKVVAERLCLEAGVALLFHSFLGSVQTDDSGRFIQSVRVANKAGLTDFKASLFVDTTGDADLAALAGAIVEKGRAVDGLSQPMTLNFRMANVDIDRMPSGEEITRRYLEAKARGEIHCPREDVLWFYANQPGVIHFNTTRVILKDATDPWALTEAEIEGRRQVQQFVAFLKKDVDGFEHSYLQTTAPQIGVRESRRIAGEYVLTAEELLAACKFDDVIARGSYPVDIHNPNGEGTVMQHLKPGEWYDIPYRCLIPRKIENLLVGGRPISATHEAHSAIRVQPIAIAIGQAAGTAAAICARDQVLPRRLNARKVQEALARQGASLGIKVK
ncbi:FAD-dependent oxidoreductase [Paenibacillus beijingensis]|uniref:FAD-dependent oxidoreductase n=1 Tax=Paenibacillus beijingensis TaxID=1126833 RepID=A0A0D5NK52_9BACL|nr:FAD-dependent oxidoreductase [Paenibacillus beijingensis]AJY75611.1 FAD-dependent oxidoreductase [Paenibacillus beijingensis]